MSLSRLSRHSGLTRTSPRSKPTTANIISGNLCGLCESLLQEVDEDDERAVSKHLRGPEKDRYLPPKANCTLCTAYPHLMVTYSRGNLLLFRDTEHGVVQLIEDETADGVSENDDNTYALELVSESTDDYARGRKARLSESTGDEGVLDLARHWISHCLDEHSRCPWNIQPERYPRRLLEIRKDMVYLRDTQQTQLKGPYATLSHCWGEQPFCVLTSDNIEQFLSGVAVADFLPTFRDAIIATRQLDIRYLWIDCYCIDQSDNMDLQHEVATMGAIYRNAIINIGAARASSPYDGCFVNRAPCLEPEDQLWSTRRLKAWSYSARYVDTSTDLFEFENLNSTFERAWCLQERLLCPRMLHFGASRIYWECDECILATDTWPGGMPFYNEPKTDLIPFSVLHSAELKHTMDNQRYAKYWARLVGNYSSMRLSRPEDDRLAAIGGVAKIMAQLTADEYIAGFFRRCLVSQLAWYSNFTKKRSDIWFAPSWSWASMDCSVTIPVPSGGSFAQIVKVDVRTADPSNKYGRLLSASLTLRGRLVEVVRLECPSENTYPRLCWGDHWMQPEFDDVQARDGLAIFLTQYYPKQPGLSCHESCSGWFVNGSGLVLQRVDHGLFSRVGAFQDHRFSEDSFKAFEDGEDMVTII